MRFHKLAVAGINKSSSVSDIQQEGVILLPVTGNSMLASSYDVMTDCQFRKKPCLLPNILFNYLR